MLKRLVFIFCTFACTAAFGQIFGNATRIDSRTDQVINARFITAFPRGWNIRSYPIRIEIVWNYETLGEARTDDESRLLKDFQFMSAGIFEADGFSLVSIAITSNTEQKYVYYAPNREEFMSRLDSIMKSRKEGYPVKVKVVEDPNWMGYRKYMKYFRKNSAFDKERDEPTEE